MSFGLFLRSLCHQRLSVELCPVPSVTWAPCGKQAFPSTQEVMPSPHAAHTAATSRSPRCSGTLCCHPPRWAMLISWPFPAQPRFGAGGMAQAKQTLTRGPTSKGVCVGPLRTAIPGEVAVKCGPPLRSQSSWGGHSVGGMSGVDTLWVGCREGKTADARAGGSWVWYHHRFLVLIPK